VDAMEINNSFIEKCLITVRSEEDKLRYEHLFGNLAVVKVDPEYLDNYEITDETWEKIKSDLLLGESMR
jgi:hypothetical protein